MSEQMIASCFVSKLQHFMELTEREKQALTALEKEERSLQSEDVLFREGHRAECLFVVKSGWMYSYRYTEGGRRQVIQLRHPGDLCGMHDLMFRQRSHTLVALEPCVVCPFPRTALMTLMREAPRVSMLISAIGTLDHVLLFDLLQAIARTSARDRVLHFLLHLVHRLRINNANMDNTVRMPVNQSLIGDLLGLTNVSISKSIGELEKNGTISRGRDTITVCDLDEAVESIGFSDRFAEMELDWLEKQA